MENWPLRTDWPIARTNYFFGIASASQRRSVRTSGCLPPNFTNRAFTSLANSLVLLGNRKCGCFFIRSAAIARAGFLLFRGRFLLNSSMVRFALSARFLAATTRGMVSSNLPAAPDHSDIFRFMSGEMGSPVSIARWYSISARRATSDCAKARLGCALRIQAVLHLRFCASSSWPPQLDHVGLLRLALGDGGLHGCAKLIIDGSDGIAGEMCVTLRCGRNLVAQ